MSRAEGKNLRIFPGRMQEALDNVDAESYGFRHSEAAGRGISWRGEGFTVRGRGDPPLPSFRGVRQYPVESPGQGLGSTMSFHRQQPTGGFFACLRRL